MTTIAPTTVNSIARQLSKEDLAEGTTIIACLWTVADMRSRGCLDDDIVAVIFRDDVFTNYALSRYIPKLAKYKLADQKAFVRELLPKS